MQIVKVEPLAKINAIFSGTHAGEYNIDGFDTREREEGRETFDWGMKKKINK